MYQPRKRYIQNEGYQVVLVSYLYQIAGWILIGIWVIMILAGCERREGMPAEALEADTELQPIQITHDPFIVLHEGHRQRAILSGGRMFQYETSDSTYAVLRAPRGESTRIHVQLFTPEGDSSATIEADSLLYFSKEGRADAYGDVVINTPDNRQMYSEHVIWRQSDRRVRSSRFVRIVTPSETLNGRGIVADEDLSSYQIGRFEAEVDLDDDDDTSSP